MHKLAANPKNILLDPGTADDLKLGVGDKVEVLFARGTRKQQLRTMTVAGLFDRFPGFPEGLNVVANLDYFPVADEDQEVSTSSSPRLTSWP